MRHEHHVDPAHLLIDKPILIVLLWPQVTSVVRLDLDAIQKHALRGAVRAVRNDLLPALPGIVAAAVLDGVAVPRMHDRAITKAEQSHVMKALETTRKVRAIRL